MLLSRLISPWKKIAIALVPTLFLTLSTGGLAGTPNPVSRWVHTGFFMHKDAYENDRVVLKLLENSSFDLKYISYFEDQQDVTWEKNMEASGRYQIRGSDIIFTIEVLVGSEDRDKPHYRCPFTLNKKALVLTRCDLFNIKNTYEFKRSDPDAFHFE